MRLEPFEAVVRRHGPTVLRVCRAVVGPDAADDAWSETFLAALRAYPALPPGSNLEAWLVTIAHRKAVDQLRAATRRAVPEKQRQTVAYHHLAGLPYAEIAALVGGTPEAARRAAADGVAALRRTYRGQTDDR